MITRAIPLAALAVCCLTGGCENTLLDRSLVFFTNTTMGVEVSVSPSDATAPVKLIIGYKRAEGVLNPVYHSQGVKAPATTDESEALAGGSSYTDKETSKSGSNSYSKKWSKSVPIAGGPKTVKRYRTEAYSVIAKIAGEVSGNAGDSAEGKLSVAQWFATGEAAKILAKQPGIAGAVTGSSEIAKEAVEQAKFTELGARSLHLTIASLRLVQSGLEDLAAEPTKYPAAGMHVASLDALSQGPAFPKSYTVDIYAFDGSTPNLFLDKATGTAFTQSGFDALLTYIAKLNSSITAIDTGIAIADIQINDNANPTIADVKTVTDAQHAAQLERTRLLQELGKFNIVRDALTYYWEQITGG